MAIIRTGPIVGAISGAVGGVVFVAGGKSAVVRPRPITVSKSSAALAVARNRMNDVRHAWKDLTPEQQTAWKTAALTQPTTNALGQTSPISAFNLFVRTAIQLLYGFEAIPILPAPAGLGESVQNVTVDFSAAGDYNVLADALQAPIVATYLYYGWPFWTDKPTRSVPRLVFLLATVTIGVLTNLRPQWEARFGPLKQGQQFAIGITGKLPFTDFPNKVIVRGEVAV